MIRSRIDVGVTLLHLIKRKTDDSLYITGLPPPWPGYSWDGSVADRGIAFLFLRRDSRHFKVRRSLGGDDRRHSRGLYANRRTIGRRVERPDVRFRHEGQTERAEGKAQEGYRADAQDARRH